MTEQQSGYNFDADPRFSKLASKWVDEIKKHPPTGIINGDTWHEVQFRLPGNILCQAAVVNGQYVALPTSETETFQGIIKVFPPMPEHEPPKRESKLRAITRADLDRVQKAVSLSAAFAGSGEGVVLALKERLMVEHPGVLPFLSQTVDHLLAHLKRRPAGTSFHQSLFLYDRPCGFPQL